MADANLKATNTFSVRSTTCDSNERNMPRIRVMGHWLEQAGFKPDSRVCVLVQHGQLIITPLPAMP
ncbi:SymE family type I addiction module toxin [Caballeronia sp. GAFFF2]|uniref:SymE family type I addiction module toxin n=1 Tax=Caballeronia sp. GAFFF2 TaxID=2921741 RepID=UPI00202772A6|nr:SymE family type I addiction module toxin [Caballeronia sp. GAFFF2]